MSDNKAVIDQIEFAMDKLIAIIFQMQKLSKFLVDDSSRHSFIQRYEEMAKKLKEMEKTIHGLGLDRDSPQFARIDGKLNDFEKQHNTFLQEIQLNKSGSDST